MADQQTDQQPLYEARRSIFPRSVKGRFRNIKWAILAFAYGVYFLLPWMRWERAAAPDQAVLFDLVGRKFYLFGLTVYPQDIFWLAGFLMLAAYLLFFVTGIAGRVFCGYFCFQTLWTDVFVLVERLVQGERPARIRLAKQPMNGEKILKLGLTHLLWLLVAFATGLSFVLYWGNAPDLIVDYFTGKAPFAAYGTTLFLTATTYVMAGHAREQVCTYMCPYSRFQSVMFDKDTLVVSYDSKRGEGSAGRAKLGKGLKSREERQAAGVGDCIDCGYCVQVCPTGIDIRDGLQMECIGCAACIDACDSIMDRMGYPRGLVRYTTENALHHKKSRLLRPRVLIYASLLVVLVAILVTSLATRTPLILDVIRDRNTLYREVGSDTIENIYTLKIVNQSQEAREFQLDVAGADSISLDGVPEPLVVEGGDVMSLPVRTRVPRDASYGIMDIEFTLTAADDPSVTVTEDSRFLGPSP